MKNNNLLIFYIILLAFCCIQCQNTPESGGKVNRNQAPPEDSEMFEDSEMVAGCLIPMKQINEIIKQDSIDGIAFDLTNTDSIDSNSIKIYEIKNLKVRGQTKLQYSVYRGNESEEIDNRKGKFKFDFADKIDSFDFAYVSASQLEALEDADYLGLSGMTIDFGKPFHKRDEFFTFLITGIHKKEDRPGVNFAPKTGESLPLFTVAAPCPPDWNPSNEMLQIMTDNVKSFRGE